MFKTPNLAKGTLSTQLLVAGTSFSLQSGEGAKFVTTGEANLYCGVFWGASFASPEKDPDAEFVVCYRQTGEGNEDKFTITSRGAEETTPKQWEIGDNFMATASDALFEEIRKFLLGAPEGTLWNGKFVVSVSNGNITVAIKTLAGNDPSVEDPVSIQINGVIRQITAALSVTVNAGANTFNSGSAELATKEIDYFVYLGYNETDGVVIGFSRIPYACSYDDFSTTATNEKYCAISTITHAAATDYYNVIGRFAATLSNIVDSYPETNYVESSHMYNGSITKVGQIFTPSNNRILKSCKFYLYKNASPTGNAVAKLYAIAGTPGVNAVPTGSALATSGNLDVSTFTSSPSLATFTFSDNYEMQANTNYAIVIEYSGGTASNYLCIGTDTSSPTHAGNGAYYNSSWNYYSNDYCFYVYTEYFWAVPTFTAKNLIQRPIYETRVLDGSGSVTGCSSYTVKTVNYKIVGSMVFVNFAINGTSNATTFSFECPFDPSSTGGTNGICRAVDNGGTAVTGVTYLNNSDSALGIYLTMASGNWTASGNKQGKGFLFYEI